MYSLGGTVLSSVTSDFNGDRRSDILSYVAPASTSASTPWGVTLALANSNGSFGTPKLLASFAANTFGYVAAGDFNGDGKIDFAVALVKHGVSTGTIHVYLGNGDGTFRASKTIAYSGGEPLSLRAGKITSDTRSDLLLGVSTGPAGAVQVFAGNGDGTFAAPKITNTWDLTYNIAMGDLNRDGKLDLAIVGGGDYQILLGRGDGTFTVKPAVQIPGGLGGYGESVIADYDNDGIPDLIATNEATPAAFSGTGEIPSLFVLKGFGDGSFNGGTFVDAGNSGFGVTLGDFTGDGRQDLAVYNALSSTVALKLASGATGLTSAPASKYSVGGDFHTFVTLLSGDVNGDGKRDLLVVTQSGVQVLLGTGGGRLRAPAATDIQSFSEDLKATDLNHDGFSDLVIRGIDIGNQFQPIENLYLALGNGTQMLTKKPSIFAVAGPDGLGPLGLGNFNTDGNIDIVMRWGVLFNNGNAQFTQPNATPANIGSSPHTIADYDTAAGDLNGDGKADLVSAELTSLTVTLGNGDGTFKPEVNYSLGGTDANAVILRDMNGDGKLDALTANYGSSTVSVLLGNGNGTFQPAKEFSVTTHPLAITVGDFNGDGKLDIAVASATKISTLLGNGLGGFTTGTTFTAGAGIQGIAAVPLRGNGIADLVVADMKGKSVRLFYGNGNGTFGGAIVYPVGDNPTSIVTGDFNADGAQDVAVTLNRSTAIPVFLNQGGTQIDEEASQSTQGVVISALVRPSLPESPTPTGTVTFREGTKIIGTVTLSGGSGRFTATSLSKGEHTVVGTYNGNSNYNKRTGGTLTFPVQ
jgi:FG-GAP-like repeat/Bacterial Ig-like domain (group 3)